MKEVHSSSFQVGADSANATSGVRSAEVRIVCYLLSKVTAFVFIQSDKNTLRKRKEVQ